MIRRWRFVGEMAFTTYFSPSVLLITSVSPLSPTSFFFLRRRLSGRQVSANLPGGWKACPGLLPLFLVFLFLCIGIWPPLSNLAQAFATP